MNYPFNVFIFILVILIILYYTLNKTLKLSAGGDKCLHSIR